MGMEREAAARCDAILIKNAQAGKPRIIRVEVACKAKRVAAIEPAVAGASPVSVPAYNHHGSIPVLGSLSKLHSTVLNS